MTSTFTKPAPRVATRIKSFEIRLLVSEDDIPEVPAIEAVEGVEYVATEFAEDGSIAVARVLAVEAVEAVPTIPAHINTGFNCQMRYDILDQDGEVMDRVIGEFSTHLTPGQEKTAKDLIEAGFKLAKDSIL